MWVRPQTTLIVAGTGFFDMNVLAKTPDIWAPIDQIEETTTVDAALGAYKKYIYGLGFNSYLIGVMANPASQTTNDILTNWPSEWIERWVDGNYVFHDPVFQHALRTGKPFLWSSTYDQASKMGKRILEESRSFGLVDGIAIPIATEFGPLGCITLGADHPELSKEDLQMLEMVSIHFFQHVQMLRKPDGSEIFGLLTKRETEVLHFVAEGKTNWEIGKILNLSEFSIKDHVHNLTTKLNANNRTQAVAVAIRNGLIIP